MALEMGSGYGSEYGGGTMLGEHRAATRAVGRGAFMGEAMISRLMDDGNSR